MNPANLKTEMKSAVKSAMAAKGFEIDNPATNGEADNYIDAMAEGMANAVVAHIQANAQAIDSGTQALPAGLWPIL